jgi:hypothetical protein
MILTNLIGTRREQINFVATRSAVLLRQKIFKIYRKKSNQQKIHNESKISKIKQKVKNLMNLR